MFQILCADWPQVKCHISLDFHHDERVRPASRADAPAGDGMLRCCALRAGN
jgi:hypothetical protein